MPKYALVDNNTIYSVQVAENLEALGALGQIYEVVQIEGLDPEPSRGWTRENGVWHPVGLPEAAKALWNGKTFEEVVDAVEETPAVEAPKETKKASK